MLSSLCVSIFFFGGNNMQEFILFSLSFILMYLIYQIFVVRKAIKYYNKKDKKSPIEVLYLVNRYNLDLKKINYKQLLQIISIVSSLDIALSVSLIVNIKNFFLEVFGGFIFVILIILISYHCVYLFYKRKGMIKNE